jgi:hypothetical protein
VWHQPHPGISVAADTERRSSVDPYTNMTLEGLSTVVANQRLRIYSQGVACGVYPNQCWSLYASTSIKEQAVAIVKDGEIMTQEMDDQ